MDKKEETLIIQAQQGNVSAFESLIYRYDGKLTGIIYQIAGNTEDTQEIYQEAFLKVFKSIKKFRFKSEFYTWLFRIVINTCLTYKKQANRSRFESYSQNDSLNWKVAGTEQTPEELVLASELGQKIDAGIQELSPKERVVFVLRHYEGYRLREIAEILDYSEGTVKNYLFRATQKMKAYLHDYRHTGQDGNHESMR